MPYYTDEQWREMSEDARKAVVEIAYARFEEEHPTRGGGIIRARIHTTNAEPDEQLSILDMLFGLFGVKR